MAIIQCSVTKSEWYQVYIEYSVSQNAITAQSTITHALKIKQLTNGYDFESNFPITYQIGSETFSHSGYVDMNDVGDAGYTITLASGTTVIQHNGDTGAGSFYVACSGTAYAGGWGPGTVTLEGRYETLPTIDRAAPNISVLASNVGVNSVTVTATSNATIDIWDYSVDNGATWYRLSTAEGNSVTGTITGLSPNTTYYIKILGRRKYNQVLGISPAVTIKTIGNTTLNSVNTLTIDDASPVLSMKWTVYANYTHKLVIKDGTITVLTIEGLTCATGTNNKTVALTSEQRTAILQYMSHKKSFTATFELTSYSGTTQIGNSSSTTATIQTTYENSAPTFVDFTHRDYNRGGTVDITGSNQLYIRDRSSMYIDIGKNEETGESNARANNSATIDLYRVTAGSYVVESRTKAFEFGSIDVAGDSVALKVEVIDSRGYSTTLTKYIKVIDYSKVSITEYSIRRINEVESKAQISFSGVFSPITVDGEVRNRVESAQIRITLNGELKGLLDKTVTQTPQTTQTFEFSQSALTTPVGYFPFDPDYQYLVEIIVTDKLASDTVSMILNKGTPLVAYRSKKVGINTADPQAALHVAGDGDLFRLNNTVVDYIEEEGVSNGWYYEKWHSGKARCWCEKTYTGLNCTRAWGVLYDTEELGGIPYPFTFVERPVEIIGGHGDEGAFLLEHLRPNDTTKTGAVYAVRPLALSGMTVTLTIDVKGFWKKNE